MIAGGTKKAWPASESGHDRAATDRSRHIASIWTRALNGRYWSPEGGRDLRIRNQAGSKLHYDSVARIQNPWSRCITRDLEKPAGLSVSVNLSFVCTEWGVKPLKEIADGSPEIRIRARHDDAAQSSHEALRTAKRAHQNVLHVRAKHH
jgi:hypothetical protein